MRPSVNNSPRELIEMSKEGKTREVWELVADKSNGLLALLNVENPTWFSKAIEEDLPAWLSLLSKKDQWRFGLDCIERVLPFYQAAFPQDSRVLDVIVVLRAYFDGKTTREEADRVIRLFSPVPKEAMAAMENVVKSPTMASEALSEMFYQAVSGPSHEEISTSTAEGKAKRERLQRRKHAQLTRAMKAESAARKPITPPSAEQMTLKLALFKASGVAQAMSELLRNEVPSACQGAQLCVAENPSSPSEEMKKELTEQALLLSGYLFRSEWQSLPLYERFGRAAKHDTKNVWEQLSENNFALLNQFEQEKPGWLAASVGAEMVAWAKLLAPRDNETFALECAARVLPLYEAAYPGDVRGREAFDAAIKYYHGEISQEICMEAIVQAITAAISCRSQALKAAMRAVISLCDPDPRRGLNAGAVANIARAAFEAPARQQEELQWQTTRLISLLKDRKA